MAAQFYTTPIHYHAINTKGQDYVIGDIHGRYDLVYQALEEIGFDEETDRLFCIGDLIDRGIHSNHVADFLSKPFVYAIRGNHEDVLLQLYEDATPNDATIEAAAEHMGLTWWFYVNDEEKKKILNALRKLPLAIEVNTICGKVGLVHADIDISLNWQEFIEDVQSRHSRVIEQALWGRTRLHYNIKDPVNGIGRVFVGHTVQDKIKQLGNVIAIDTGAVFNKHLTIINLITQDKVIKNAKKPTKPIHILQPSNDPILPF